MPVYKFGDMLVDPQKYPWGHNFMPEALFYSHGDENINLTGGYYESHQDGSGATEKKSDHLRMYTTDNNGGVTFATTNKIRLDNVHKIIVSWELVGTHDSQQNATLGVDTNPENIKRNSGEYHYNTGVSGGFSLREDELDVSAAQGDYHIGVNGEVSSSFSGTVDLKVYEIRGVDVNGELVTI